MGTYGNLTFLSEDEIPDVIVLAEQILGVFGLGFGKIEELVPPVDVDKILLQFLQDGCLVVSHLVAFLRIIVRDDVPLHHL